MAEQSASIVDIVGFGLQLGTTLLSYVETSRDAKDGLLDVASDVNATASALKQLQDLLRADDVESTQMQVFKPDGRQEIMAMTIQCQSLYTTIVVLLTKAGSANGKGKAKGNVTFDSVGNSMLKVSSLTRDMNWDWLEQRIERCQEQLGWLKMSLLLSLHLANLAHFQIRTTQRIPGSFEEELRMRALAERLRRKKVKSTKVLLQRQWRSEIASRLSSASSVVIIEDSPRIIDISDGQSGTQNLPATHPDTFNKDIQDSKPTGLVYEDHVGPKNQNDRAADEKSESSVTLNNFEDDSKKGDLSVDTVSTTTAKALDKSKTLTSKTSNVKEDSKEIEVFQSLPLYESKISSWVRRIFGQRDRWLGDWQSEDLEGYVILRDSTIFKLPLGHKALSARVKAMRKKNDASFWSTFLTAHPRFYQILSHMLNESMRIDGRERTCIAFEVFTTGKSLREPAPHDQLLVIFSLEKPAESVLLEDCVGRKMVIPFHLCPTWDDMHELISQAFKYVAVVGPHVEAGHYDLLTSNGEHIVPQTWKSQVKPGWRIEMKLWPMLRESYAYTPAYPPTESGIPNDLTVYKRSPLASATLRSSIENAKASTLLAAEQAKSTSIPMLRLKDAVGRLYSFPFEKCRTKAQIGALIIDAFRHVEVIGTHVLAGRYDLISPAGYIILASVWEKTVQPGWLISMHMWPIPSLPLLPPHTLRPGDPYIPSSLRKPPPPPAWISHGENSQHPMVPRATPAPPGFIGMHPFPGVIRRRGNSSSSSTSTSSSSLVEDEDIVNEDGDFGIRIDLEREERDNEVGLGELLGRWTNAIDTEVETFFEGESDSEDGSSTCSSLSDD